jgi:CRISPR-associated exonuclease Cas4
MTLAIAALAAALLLLAVSLVLYRRAGLSGRIIASDGPVSRPSRVLRSARHGISGKPDYLVVEGGKVAPVELKPGRESDRPWLRDIVQLAAYCLLVQETHEHFAGYGYLRYARRTFRIEFTDTMRTEVLRTAEALRADLSAHDVDPNHNDPRRCARCALREPCGRPVTA